jgi:hypothetical protein
VGLREMAARKNNRESARRERRDVHERMAWLHWDSHANGNDNSEELADLARREEILNIVVKTGDWP